MSKFKSKLEDLNYNSLSVLRAEKRNGKIIIVLEAGLYSDEVFAVNPYYSEGDSKNQLQAAHFNVSITEKGGSVTVKPEFGNSLGHFTKGHTQVHESIKNLFKDKKDLAIYEVLTVDEKYLIDESRMNKLIKMWDCDVEFQSHVVNLICNRKKDIKNNRIIECQKKYHEALKELEQAMGIEA